MNHSHDHVAYPSGAPAEAFTREATYAATRRPVDLAQTLTPEAYTSEAFYAVERERVFADGLGRRRLLRAATGARRCARQPRWRDAPSSSCASATGSYGRSTTPAATAARSSWRRASAASSASSAARITAGRTTSTARASGRRCSRARTSRGSAGRVRHGGRQGVRSRGLRAAAGRGRRLGPAGLREPRPGLRAAGRRPRRPARAHRRPSPRGVGDRPRRGVRDRGQLQARGRELHGVLPPAVGPSGAGQGLADRGPPSLAGARHVLGILHHADRTGHRGGRLAEAAPSDRRARRVRRRQRAVHLAVPQRRGQHPAEPRLHHPRARDEPAIDDETTYLLTHPESTAAGTASRPSSSWRASGTPSIARTSRSWSGCRRASTRRRSRAAASATGSRSRSIASRTWSSTAWSANAGSPGRRRRGRADVQPEQ